MIAAAAVKRVLLAALLLYVAIALAAAYWALAGRGSILLRGDNPRLIEAAARVRRGAIYDRREQLLVESAPENGAENGTMTRAYLRPSTYSLLGYSSWRYGVAGIEAAFDAELSGATSPHRFLQRFADYVMREVLHVPPAGMDLRLSLAADIQDALAGAMQSQRGAAVVMDAADGAILALLSLPSYDPNRLDQDWQRLIAAEGEPFFNRALQGLYQPGLALTGFWLAQAMQSGFELSTAFNDAQSPVEIEPGLTLQCIFEPGGDIVMVTLAQAFIYGCPAPFVDYVATLNEASYASVIETFAPEEAITLAGMPLPAASDMPPLSSRAAASAAPRPRDVLGQGDLRLTPLHMASVMAAIAADGAAPTPYILSGMRQPGAQVWQPQAPQASARVIMDAGTAAELRGAFQESWQALRGKSAARAQEVGAQVASARSGERAQLWLTGFVRSGPEAAVAFAVLLEDSSDINALVAIGDALIRALTDALAQMQQQRSGQLHQNFLPQRHRGTEGK